MAFSRFSLARVSALCSVSFSSSIPVSPLTLLLPQIRNFTLSGSIRSQDSSPLVISPSPKKTGRWKPMCLYYTQDKCTKMDDPIHLEKFNHSCSVELQANTNEFKHIRSQHLDFFLVLDLEGKVEILEFPVVMINAKTMDVVNFFHRFVRPSEMSEQKINEYIEGKYGKFGVDRVWHDTAIPFKEVIHQFEAWMIEHQLWGKGRDDRLNRAAFVTCGNWDLKTKIPQQCKVSRMKLPAYFLEWINIKDVYLNFYKRRAGFEVEHLLFGPCYKVCPNSACPIDRRNSEYIALSENKPKTEPWPLE